MKTLRFEGYSDDTFGEYALTREDYDNRASGEPIEFMVSSGADRLLVTGQHCPSRMSGGWMIGVTSALDPGGSDRPVPAWPIRFEQSEREYSPALIIEAPDDVEVRCLTREADRCST